MLQVVCEWIVDRCASLPASSGEPGLVTQISWRTHTHIHTQRKQGQTILGESTVAYTFIGEFHVIVFLVLLPHMHRCMLGRTDPLTLITDG